GFFLMLLVLPLQALNTVGTWEHEMDARMQGFRQRSGRDWSAVNDDSLIVAYYGHPRSRYMGIVGRHNLEELTRLVRSTAAQYQAAAGGREVVPALYLIYGTVQPQGQIGYMSDRLTRQHIHHAMENGLLIFLDHQIGTYTLKDALDRLLPYLVYPNVHIALDFEWRTAHPMREIGYVRGEELNWIQGYVQDYLERNRIPGTRFVVFHQFTKSMVRDPAVIHTRFPQVSLIHSTSGWGPPDKKAATHTLNSRISQIPLKGFKLWYFYSDKPGIHFDDPLMTPDQVLALDPQPMLIIYQ
ncbi:MAG TPA: hypothetical protein VLH39_00465, partial [Magnetospirillaceae bacterium]|nr:hypothetical protein [Magnetospirillaceae bacterium]